MYLRLLYLVTFIVGINCQTNDPLFGKFESTAPETDTFSPEYLDLEMRWDKIFPKAIINYTLDSRYFEEDKIYQAKCKVVFDRPVENFEVCFMGNENNFGCYLASDYGKNIEWQSNLAETSSNITVLENEEESSYPEYTIFLKHLERNQSTHCKVTVLSKKHPIRFISNPIQIFTLKSNSNIIVGISYIEQTEYYGDDSSYIEYFNIYTCKVTFSDEYEHEGAEISFFYRNKSYTISADLRHYGMNVYTATLKEYASGDPIDSCQVRLADGRTYESN